MEQLSIMVANKMLAATENVDIVHFLKEEDVQTMVVVYRIFLKELSGRPSCRSVRAARVVLESALDTLSQQLSAVYAKLSERRSGLFGRLRGRAYVNDLKVEKELIQKQLDLVKKRKKMLVDVMNASVGFDPTEEDAEEVNFVKVSTQDII